MNVDADRVEKLISQPFPAQINDRSRCLAPADDYGTQKPSPTVAEVAARALGQDR